MRRLSLACLLVVVVSPLCHGQTNPGPQGDRLWTPEELRALADSAKPGTMFKLSQSKVTSTGGSNKEVRTAEGNGASGGASGEKSAEFQIKNTEAPSANAGTAPAASGGDFFGKGGAEGFQFPYMSMLLVAVGILIVGFGGWKVYKHEPINNAIPYFVAGGGFIAAGLVPPHIAALCIAVAAVVGVVYFMRQQMLEKRAKEQLAKKEQEATLNLERADDMENAAKSLVNMLDKLRSDTQFGTQIKTAMTAKKDAILLELSPTAKAIVAKEKVT